MLSGVLFRISSVLFEYSFVLRILVQRMRQWKHWFGIFACFM